MLYREILQKCFDKDNGQFYFFKFVIGGLEELGYPHPFRYNILLRKWNKLIKNHKYLATLCARGHGKSLYFSVANNLYEMFLFPFKRIILISASQDQADELLDTMKTIIENNEWLLTKKDNNKWATQRIGYNKGYVLTAGVGSEILGHHVDRIVVDDVLRSDNKLTDQQIEDYIDMNLMPMLLNRNGQMLVVGTPKTEKDIFARIRQRIKDETNCSWKLYEYPAILDYDKKILQCPDRFTWDQIMDKRLSMGPLKFAREYQLEFFSRDQALFTRDMIEMSTKNGKQVRLLELADKRDPSWMFVAGVDVARSGAVSADYTVVFVLAYNSISQTKQIVYMWREKGLKISEQAYYIANISRKFNNCQVLVEQNNMGQEMIERLTDDYNVGVEAFVTGGKGQKKDELIRFLITAFEHEQIIIPQGDDNSRNAMEKLIEELNRFCVTITPAGNEKFEGVGHDDCVMALALANKATQILGTPFAVSSFGGRNSSVDMMSNQYDSLLNRDNSPESDLVKLIRMGILK